MVLIPVVPKEHLPQGADRTNPADGSPVVFWGDAEGSPVALLDVGNVSPLRWSSEEEGEYDVVAKFSSDEEDEDGLAPTEFEEEDEDEESAPSTSGLVSSKKRSREESDVEQVSTKRQKFSCEDPAPSTSSGPISSRSSPGLGLSRITEEDYWNSEPPSSPDLSLSWSSEEDYRDPEPPSSPGLGLSRSTEEDYRNSAPSTSSGLGLSTNRTSWFRPFYHEMFSDDSDDSDSG